MTLKKTSKPKEKKVATPKTIRRTYLYAVGRRKSSIARVRLHKKADKPGIIINDKTLAEYCQAKNIERTILAPLVVVSLDKDLPSISVKVTGGGFSSQAGATQLGIARVLIKFDPELRPLLKAQKMLSRDPRVKERKKPGLKRARRAPQWSKR